MKEYILNKWLILLLIISAGLASCDEMFDQTAGNRITPEEHYQTVKDLEISMQGVLVPLQDAMAKLIIADGLLSDQMVLTENIDVDMLNANLHNYSFDNPYLNTSGLYKVIVNANEVLANIDRISEVDPNFDEFYVKQYANAMVGMRSWAYFTLARLNGEVAYIDDRMATIPEDGLTYLSKEVILDTLVSQLHRYIHIDTELEELYLPLYVNTKILLGEIYLEKDDYNKAIEYFTLGISSYGNDSELYKIADKAYKARNWKNMFITGLPVYSINVRDLEKENISVVPFKSTDDQYNPLTGMTLPNASYLVRPSNVLMEMFNKQINSKGTEGDDYRGLTVSFDYTSDEKPYIKKYGLIEAEPYSANIIISRAADAHLMLAEALNRAGRTQDALTFLNDGITNADKRPEGFPRWNKNIGVRNRVALQNVTVPSDVDNVVEYVEDLIIQERAMELAFEGKRYMDLIRIAERRNDPEYLASRVYNKFEDKDQGQKVKEFLRNSENWYIPLNK